MNTIKKYATTISLVFLLIGGLLLYYTNSYDISTKTISVIKDNTIVDKVIYTIDSNDLFLKILATILLNLGIALFISSYFIKFIEEDEKNNFYDKLKMFQKDTAKDAIHSVFNRIINDKFFAIIQKDVLNVKLIRKNAQWQYDIIINNNNKPVLKRTVSYELHNISNETAQESINLQAITGLHSSMEIISGKIRYSNGTEDQMMFSVSSEAKSNIKAIDRELSLEPHETMEVVIVVEHTFHNDYIYECHSSKHPIVGLEITVNYPTNFDFELFSTFSTEPRIRVNESGKTVYVIDGAIYKGQGVEFICSSKDKKLLTDDF